MTGMGDRLAGFPARSRWPQTLLRAGISVAILGWLLWRLDWPHLLEVLRQAEPQGWFIALVIYGVVQLGLASYRWRLLGRALGFHQPWRRYLGLCYEGLFFSLFLPTSIGGDVVRALRLADEPRRRLAAGWSVVSDRLSGLVALVGVACVASIWQVQLLPVIAQAGLWLLALGLVVGRFWLPRLARRSERLNNLATALSLSQAYRRESWSALGLSLAIQLASIVQIAYMGRALGLDLGLGVYAVVVPLVALATMVPVSIGGLGVREGSFVVLLAPYGVPATTAVALGLSWLAMNVVVGLVGGLVYLASDAVPAPSDALNEGVGHGRVGHRADQGRAGELETAA
ncbi:MAG TPA: lysylphosphatidylglycerol synthase transmembrane domain-containing protein [Gemmatales bacterium]|nr:lysylphosphatidylglycerol synthase transmembrane domain-containing protein [Gemmatales bacterium]HMP61106.1 lysylphosphatidylglycerol synthase transmembrane domain-containing protein [Gemmatales bacterium]